MPELTEEEIMNMSPEQRAALEKQNCIFCHIAAGSVPAHIVYKDELVTAFLDIRPAEIGQTLIIPNEHYQIMPQIPPETIARIFAVAKGISNALLKAMKAEGTTIFAANGMAAGQKAPHFIVYVFPRKENDSLQSLSKIPERQISDEQMEEIKKVISEGVKKELNFNIYEGNGAEEKKEESEKELPEKSGDEKTEEAQQTEELPAIEEDNSKEEFKKLIEEKPHIIELAKEKPDEVLEGLKKKYPDKFKNLDLKKMQECIGGEKNG